MSNDVKGGWTPGPWTFGMSADSRPHFYFHVGPKRRLEWHLETWGDVAVTEQDARLIASAPELFEALQVLLEFDGISAREKARAAIAKATGGTPTP